MEREWKRIGKGKEGKANDIELIVCNIPTLGKIQVQNACPRQ